MKVGWVKVDLFCVCCGVSGLVGLGSVHLYRFGEEAVFQCCGVCAGCDRASQGGLELMTSGMRDRWASKET